jgi:type IV pilus assembly protein PilQ
MIRKSLTRLIFLILLGSFALAGIPDGDKKISLQFENISIASVLNLLAQQYNLNIVQSGQIDQKISIKLDQVYLSDALNAILISNGYNYYLAGDILVVKPIDVVAPGETTAKIFTMNYISPSAAAIAISDILSPKGKAKPIEEASQSVKSGTVQNATQIVVVDFPEVIEKVEKFLLEIDKPQPQIAIEVRMIETRVDNGKKVGFSWPTSLSGRAHGVELTSESSTSSTEAIGQIQLPDGQWEWGKLSVDQVKLVLDFLQTAGNSKLLSNPRITTLNNHQAEIKVLTIIPIQTINRFSEGGAVQDIVTFQDEEIGISLLVTPHIVEGGNILLDVMPTVAEIIGYAGPEGNQKPITSERTVQTKISVKDGETAVLGGLLKENKIENKQKIFLLGSIPILGNLFRHKSVETSTTDLTILITPKIIKE